MYLVCKIQNKIFKAHMFIILSNLVFMEKLILDLIVVTYSEWLITIIALF